MRVLSAAELLDAWEACRVLPPPQRSLALLLAALPEVSVQELAHESVGQRDGRLLTLREQVFGRQIAALATCQKCGLHVDLAFTTTDIRASEAAPDAIAVAQVDGYRAVIRAINSFDLMELQAADGHISQRIPPGRFPVRTANAEADAGVHAGVNVESDAGTAAGLQPAPVRGSEAGYRVLLGRCLIEARHDGDPVPAAALPNNVVTSIAGCLGELDPQAEVLLDMVCPDCGTQWQALFDIAGFLWAELDAWARRTLLEVHRLAWTYGWREADILALSQQRRQRYLQMIG